MSVLRPGCELVLSPSQMLAGGDQPGVLQHPNEWVRLRGGAYDWEEEAEKVSFPIWQDDFHRGLDKGLQQARGKHEAFQSTVE